MCAGAAAAATIVGTARGELLRGTARADVVRAGAGNDRIAVEMDGARDRVFCGRGRDVVTADRIDRIAADCEIVSRALSRDTYRNPESQHETQAEPDSLSVGSTIVTTFQTGRRFDGGAADIGFSTSRDGGRTWRSGHLPGLTVHSTPRGTAGLASDPVVAYDAAHGLWLIATLAISTGRSELYVSRSPDGLSWERPVVAAVAAQDELAYDKEWIACDDGPASPFYGRCYLAYTDHQSRPAIAVLTSTDGGATWSEPVIATRGRTAVGVIPVVQPDGAVVFPYLGDGVIAAVRTADGGATFTGPATIAPVRAADVARVRAFPLPATDVGPDGRIHVVWHDCRFRADCTANDVVAASSADGTVWEAPRRVTRGANAFVPAIAVDPASGRLAVSYHTLGSTSGRIDLYHTASATGGASWRRPVRLSAQAMALPWIAKTNSGRMLADYISISFVRGRAVTVYALASPPRGRTLRQAIYATKPLP